MDTVDVIEDAMHLGVWAEQHGVDGRGQVHECLHRRRAAPHAVVQGEGITSAVQVDNPTSRACCKVPEDKTQQQQQSIVKQTSLKGQ